MKDVLGGDLKVSFPNDGGGGGACASGQHLYNCTVITNDCGTANGVTCGGSAGIAQDYNLNYWYKLGCGGATVECSY